MISVAAAVEYKLKKMGKFSGARVSTKDGSITEWNVLGIPQPSFADITAWQNEAETDTAAEHNARKNRKQALATKLKIDAADIPVLRELLADGNLD